MNDRKTRKRKARFNRISIDGTTATVTQPNGVTYLVDTVDLALASEWSWQGVGTKKRYLNAHSVGYLHRQIVAQYVSPEELLTHTVDHINNDPRDNRRANLRLVSGPLNSALKRRIPKKYRCVTPSGEGFRGQVMFNRVIYYHYAPTAEQAAQWVDRMYRAHYGKDVPQDLLNFPSEAA